MISSLSTLQRRYLPASLLVFAVAMPCVEAAASTPQYAVSEAPIYPEDEIFWVEKYPTDIIKDYLALISAKEPIVPGQDFLNKIFRKSSGGNDLARMFPTLVRYGHVSQDSAYLSHKDINKILCSIGRCSGFYLVHMSWFAQSQFKEDEWIFSRAEESLKSAYTDLWSKFTLNKFIDLGRKFGLTPAVSPKVNSPIFLPGDDTSWTILVDKDGVPCLMAMHGRLPNNDPWSPEAAEEILYQFFLIVA